ncbi:MAG: carbamate kinase [Planctomycetes bacterium]|nr:carbamate kinase [Planctomycetota bacterium]
MNSNKVAPSRLVIALGGNAISQTREEGNVDQQFSNSRKTARALADLVQAGHQLVITHGNGPQIGNFLLRNEAGASRIYPLPMEVAVAHVQGGMGFMIAQTLMNELNRRGDPRVVTAMVTTIVVDADDFGFRNPTKPVGRPLTREEADQFERDEGWAVKEVSPGTYRRVVPSPAPRHIQEIETIRRAVDAGDLVVACGGGGIPVLRDADDGFRGVRAVIDKDLASALLAVELQADAMTILTNVERVCLDFGTPHSREIDRMTLSQARQWLQQGQFPDGSMGPKIQGAVNFLESTNKPDAYVAIGPLDRAVEAVAGQAGTRITR